MKHEVRFSMTAEEELERIYIYIAEQSNPEIALAFTSAIHGHCMGLQVFPLRGPRRDDIRPGVRILPFRSNVTIAYHIDDGVVFIDNILYGGRDISTALG